MVKLKLRLLVVASRRYSADLDFEPAVVARGERGRLWLTQLTAAIAGQG